MEATKVIRKFLRQHFSFLIIPTS